MWEKMDSASQQISSETSLPRNRIWPAFARLVSIFFVFLSAYTLSSLAAQPRSNNVLLQDKVFEPGDNLPITANHQKRFQSAIGKNSTTSSSEDFERLQFPPTINCAGSQTVCANTGNSYVHSGSAWDATATGSAGCLTIVS